MIETLHPASREEWLAMRKNSIGASEVAALFDEHPWLTSYELWARKSGRVLDVEETAQMRRGRRLEPIAIDILREERPAWVIKPNVIGGGGKFIRDLDCGTSCTPDAFVEDPDRDGFGICQIKTVEQHAFRNKWCGLDEREPPVYIAIQALQETAMTGATWCCVLAIVGFDLAPYIFEIRLTPGLTGRIRNEAVEFWRRVRENDPYPPDYVRDGDVIKRIYADDDGGEIELSGSEQALTLVARREDLKRIEDAGSTAMTERKTVDAELIHLLGNATRGTLSDGRVIEARTIRKKGYTVEPTSFRSIKIKQRNVA